MSDDSELQQRWRSSELYRRLMSEMKIKVSANERLNPLLQRLALGLELTPEMIRFAELQHSSSNGSTLSDVVQNLASKIQVTAETIYGQKWNFYSGALNPAAANIFEQSVLGLNQKHRTIDYLEIGSCQGLSMSMVATLIQYYSELGLCVSVDPYFDEGYVEGGSGVWGIEREISIDKKTRDSALMLYKKLNLGVQHIEATSTNGLRSLIQQDRRFHLIYIDGSHEQMVPLRDLGLSFEVINPGGIIMLDDHNWPDVKPIKELCDKHCEKVAESWKIAAYMVP